MPVPLGSPKNTFGTGDLLTGTRHGELLGRGERLLRGPRERRQEAVAGNESYSTSISSSALQQRLRRQRTTTTTTPRATSTRSTCPANTTSLKLDVYDAEYNQSSTSDNELANNQTINTTYQIYDRNATPLDLSNLTLLSTVNVADEQRARTRTSGRTSTRGPTRRRGSTTSGCSPTATDTTNSRGSNGFSLRAYTGSVFATCTTITRFGELLGDVPAGARGQRHVDLRERHGHERRRSTWRRSTRSTRARRCASTSSTPARAPRRSRSSTRTATRRRSRGAHRATRRRRRRAVAAARGSRHSNVSGTGTQPYTGLNGTLEVQRPLHHHRHPAARRTTRPSTAARSGGRCKYTTLASSVTDRTTWSVNIVGDPVHLLQ